MENYFNSIKSLLPKNKKGMGIGDIYPVVLTIALVAILIAIVMFVLSQFGATVATESRSVTNESGAYVNITGYPLAHDNSSTCEFNTPTITAVWVNVSGTGYIIPAANYSLTGSLLYNATIIPNSTQYDDANVSYHYLYGGAPCEATAEIIDDFVDFIPWIGVILLVVAAAIVLGVLMRSFGTGGRV